VALWRGNWLRETLIGGRRNGWFRCHSGGHLLRMRVKIKDIYWLFNVLILEEMTQAKLNWLAKLPLEPRLLEDRTMRTHYATNRLLSVLQRRSRPIIN